MSFCGLIKGISPKICILCVCVKINKRSFEPFCVWMLFSWPRVDNWGCSDEQEKKKETVERHVKNVCSKKLCADYV